MSPQPHDAADQIASRKAAMALFAQATTHEIVVGLRFVGAPVAHTELRKPETGLVMLRGRIGGDGAPFNFGEATVTRCAVQLSSGEIGISYQLGRDRDKARLAALCDALFQHPDYHDMLQEKLLVPLRQRIEQDQAEAAQRTAATRVDFFSLVRGED